jgi:hypothetical protein
MTFKKIDARLYAATLTAKIGSRSYRIDLRIDGREGDYRVDRLGTLGYIWEAIDSGRGFSSVAKATAHAGNGSGRRSRKATFAHGSSASSARGSAGARRRRGRRSKNFKES